MQLYYYFIQDNHGLIIMLLFLALVYVFVVQYGWRHKQNVYVNMQPRQKQYLAFRTVGLANG